MDVATHTGTPIMRPMFYDFYMDEVCYGLEDQYMFGEDILVAPIMKQHQTSRKVYLPEGTWVDVNTKAVIQGKMWVDCKASIDTFIAYTREGSEVTKLF